MAFATLLCGLALATPAHHTFSHDTQHFLLDGKPFIIRSGEMHYPRIPHQYWRDRMKKARAMGLNTICTYVFWNVHEPKPGKFNFSGDLNVAEFIKTAQEEGLFVIVRPGPYICTEWDFGGIPSWLLKDRKTVVRTNDPTFLAATERYMKRLGKELKPLMLSNGGPVILTQVENEYGSFGNDHVYMGKIHDIIKNAGFDGEMYTSDGPGQDMLKGGTLPDLLSVVNFGGGAEGAFKEFSKFRPNAPKMTGEYWCGWFDQWGHDHSTTSAVDHAKDIDWMLSNDVSFNLYMFHGGTNFGFMAGANGGRKSYDCDMTNYDYDGPVDEAGRVTHKFEIFRDAIIRHLPAGEELPSLPSPLPMISIPTFTLNETAPLAMAQTKAREFATPPTMEDLDQSYGFVSYETTVKGPVSGDLQIDTLRDYAIVYANGRRLGVIDRRLKQNSLKVELPAGETRLRILVENLGRVNFGHEFGIERKGIDGSVRLGGVELKDWTVSGLPLENLNGVRFSNQITPGPAFYRAQFNLSSTGDTYLDMRGWGHGFVWVNGHNLGRYWKIGAQQSLFLPGVWLKKGVNQVVVLDLEEGRNRSISSGMQPIWEVRK